MEKKFKPGDLAKRITVCNAESVNVGDIAIILSEPYLSHYSSTSEYFVKVMVLKNNIIQPWYVCYTELIC